MTEQPRDPGGRFPTTPETLERETQAVALRARRMSYRQIADALGYAHPDSARRAVQRGLTRIHQDSLVESRQMMLEHLDVLIGKFWEIAQRRHVLVQQGRIVKEQTPDGPMTLEDDGPTMDALREIAKLEKQRADILGVAAPKRVEVITRDAVDAAIADLAAELAGRGVALPSGVAQAATGTEGAGGPGG